MRFDYTYRNTAGDYWAYFFFNIYMRFTGLINGMFILSILILMIRRWETSGAFGRSVMVFGLSLFLVIQPIALWIRALKQVEIIGDVDTRLIVGEGGLTISVRGHNQHINWQDYRGTVKRPTFLLLMPDEQHGYILPNRVMGKDREALYTFLKERKA
ncbi:MAG: YcxB family protein [Lachnospiraceae bacterium]|nr:YcxB family protein [Lachnospiraceae bacterium]